MKYQQTKKGFLLHAFGYTKALNYGILALCCALSIKTNLKINNITVVMDWGTKEWLVSNFSKHIIKSAFDNIIVSDEKFPSGDKINFNTPWKTYKSKFNNQNRVLSYEYSPYDETILIDVDFFIMDNSFDDVWGSNEDLLLNKKAIDLQGNIFGTEKDQILSTYGIPQYWATIVYFKKSEYAQRFFDLINYIRKEYTFFQFLYNFKEGYYRNDFSFSIAAHMLNGYIKNGAKSFPQDSILSSYQEDSIVSMIKHNEFLFLSNNIKEPWKNTLVNIKERNVHIMNKKEIMRISDKYIKICMEKL